MSTLTLTLPPHVAALFEKDEDARHRLEALAARMVDGDDELTGEDLARALSAKAQIEAGETLSLEEARESSLSLFEKARQADLTAYRERVATTGRLSIEEALERMKALPFPEGVVLDDSRASYYEDDQGRLPGMDGYGH